MFSYLQYKPDNDNDKNDWYTEIGYTTSNA